MNPHQLSEERSLEYHREIARCLRTEPRLLDDARRLLNAWTARGGRAQHLLARWRDQLERPLDELEAFLVDPSEQARELRACSPFAGTLAPRERWRIWRAVRARHPEVQ